MSFKHVLRMFGLVTENDFIELKKNYDDKLFKLKNDLENECKMKRQLEREIGNCLICLTEVSQNPKYAAQGQKLRTDSNLSFDDVSEGMNQLYYWLEHEAEKQLNN